jgi:hypothetical protein
MAAANCSRTQIVSVIMFIPAVDNANQEPEAQHQQFRSLALLLAFRQ